MVKNMNYLQSLTKYLTTYCTKPENLEIWIENDTQTFSADTNIQGYESKQVINFMISDTSIKFIELKMHIAVWITRHIPDYDAQDVQPPQYNMAVLEGGNVDVLGVLELIETVSLVKDEAGSWEVDGQRMALKTDYQEAFDPSIAGSLVIVDSHTQDNGLQDEWK